MTRTPHHDAAVAARAAAPIDEERLRALVAELTLDEKIRLLTGRDFWTTHPIERIGLRAMTLSDGPSGVRGPVWDERSSSLNLPSATALAATWDPDIAWRYGAAAAAEARRKGVDVVLGPTINLHRTPTNGRHFEAFSEDPILTARLAAAYVRGVQENGIAATPKHYIANDFEEERYTVDVRVDERPLRELYLRAFEDAVCEARAWAVMSSYNAINGVTATENDLLHAPLNTEWGFDGVVVSDWTAVRSVAPSALADQDLEMPAPGVWPAALAQAVRDGEVPEAAIDRKVVRILGLAARVGALRGFDAVQAAPVHREDGPAFAREAAAEGMVLLRNTGVLPLEEPDARIAVIGDSAVRARTQGGGSATVVPERVVSPLDGLKRALPQATIDYRVGALVQRGVAELPLERIANPATGEPGALVRFLDADGEEIFREDRRATSLVWFGGDAPVERTETLELHTIYTPAETGRIRLGFGSVGLGRVYLDGALVHEADVEAEGTDLGAALLLPPSSTVEAETVAGRPIDVRVTLRRRGADGALGGTMGLNVGWEPAETDARALIDEAVQAAAAADIAVVVVGTDAKVESEGFDRETLALPGHQDELVAAVARANPRTVVVVNSGAPVLMPWRDDVAAVLLGWFGGQEFGDALADVLTGAAEPGGRLTTTWPADERDVPILHADVRDGIVRYDEGVHIGYRAWLRSGAEPAYPFGAGQGYTSWRIDDARIEGSGVIGLGDEATLAVTLTNTGRRPGKHVVQAYARRDASAVDRPATWLVGFAAVRAEAGEQAVARITVRARDLAHWDGTWQLEPGAFAIDIGSHVGDRAHTLELVAR